MAMLWAIAKQWCAG